MKLIAAAITTLLIVNIGSTSDAFSQERTIRIATEGAYAPWSITKPNGQLDGFEVDLAKEICSRLEDGCEIVAQDWDGMIPSLNGGKIDVIMSAMSITEKRKEVVAFSDIYMPTSSTFITSEQNELSKLPENGVLINLDNKDKALDDVIATLKPLLKGKVIGVQGSTTNTTLLDDYFSGSPDIREYKTTQAHDLDLSSGRVDGVFATVTVAKSALEKPALKGFTTAGPIFSGGILGPGVAAAMRKDDNSLRTSYNSALSTLIADGTLSKLSVKWFGADLAPH